MVSVMVGFSSFEKKSVCIFFHTLKPIPSSAFIVKGERSRKSSHSSTPNVPSAKGLGLGTTSSTCETSNVPWKSMFASRMFWNDTLIHGL